MQLNFEINDHLVTTSVTTTILNVALLTAIVTVAPPFASLTYSQRMDYQNGKLDALKQVATLLGTAPMLIEPMLPSRWPATRRSGCG